MIGRSHQDVYVDADGTVHNHRMQSAECNRSLRANHVCPSCGSSEDIDRMNLAENNICSDGVFWHCWACEHEWGDGRD